MSKVIDFMRLCLERKEIPQSWGITNVITSKNKVSFDVFGSKYQGKIIIIEVDSMVIVRKNDAEMKFSVSDELFAWLDKLIE